MPRTLKAITGERPRCQYCGKGVQPRTHRVLVLGHMTEVPTIEELRTLPQPELHYPSVEEAIKWGYEPDRVFRMASKTKVWEKPNPIQSQGSNGAVGNTRSIISTWKSSRKRSGSRADSVR
jgi:hypothetical protein